MAGVTLDAFKLGVSVVELRFTGTALVINTGTPNMLLTLTCNRDCALDTHGANAAMQAANDNAIRIFIIPPCFPEIGGKPASREKLGPHSHSGKGVDYGVDTASGLIWRDRPTPRAAAMVRQPSN
jgi:hypothetical protein